MLQRTSIIILFALLTCAVCFAQTSYKGLTPGKSTRAEAERVLGSPVKVSSPTLSEYAGVDESNTYFVGKIYVQYRDPSPAATIDRIELVCDKHSGVPENRYDGCGDIWSRSKDGRMFARIVEKKGADTFRRREYWGVPSLIMRTWTTAGEETITSRVGLYSAELFERAVPKNCTGTFLGEWETNRGRLLISDIPGTQYEDTKGTYSLNNGTVIGHASFGPTFTGEWKDSTGSGTFELKINPGSAFETTWPDPTKVFTGTWERKTGKGPKKGTWEGRCVDANTAGNQ